MIFTWPSSGFSPDLSWHIKLFCRFCLTMLVVWWSFHVSWWLSHGNSHKFWDIDSLPVQQCWTKALPESLSQYWHVHNYSPPRFCLFCLVFLALSTHIPKSHYVSIGQSMKEVLTNRDPQNHSIAAFYKSILRLDIDINASTTQKNISQFTLIIFVWCLDWWGIYFTPQEYLFYLISVIIQLVRFETENQNWNQIFKLSNDLFLEINYSILSLLYTNPIQWTKLVTMY